MRIGIANDLSLARAVLRKVVESVPGYAVAWEAADGADAVAKATADRPDAVLMDLVMPGVDGAEATRRIMASAPCPVLIVTSSVGANHGKVYEALGAGGLDAVRTPALGPGGTVRGAEPLLARLAKLTRAAAPPTPLRAIPTPPPGFVTPSPLHPFTPSPLHPLLAVAASTGGPEALARVLSGLGPGFAAPVVIAQHIGSDYTPGLAAWLSARTGRVVKLPAAGERPQPGVAYLAGGDDHLAVDADGRFRFTPYPLDYPYRPSADVLFDSLAAHWPAGGVGVVLTGMGSDGARGLLALRNRGWHTIAQDAATCAVYGMPKAAAELGAAAEVLPVDRVGPAAGSRLAAGRR